MATARPILPAALEVPLIKHFEWSPTDLPEEDDQNLESDWHRLAMNLLIDSLRHHWRERDDVFIGGNMFIYYRSGPEQILQFRGPDFFVAKNVERNKQRPYWQVWNEGGVYPNVILELLSKTTEEIDRTEKKDVYEQTFRTPEYFLHNPVDAALTGFRLDGGNYQPIAPDERGWLWSAELQLWLGVWQGSFQEEMGSFVRFFAANGQAVLTGKEHEARLKLAETQRAEAEKQRADAEKQRADAAEAELARLRALLGQQSNSNNPNS